MISQLKIGSIHYSFKDWIIQRLASLAVIFYFLTLLICFFLIPNSYLAWQYLFSCTWLKIWTEIAMLAFSWMLWIEIRDLLMDYVKSVELRIFLFWIVVFWLLGCFIYLTQIIWN